MTKLKKRELLTPKNQKWVDLLDFYYKKWQNILDEDDTHSISNGSLRDTSTKANKQKLKKLKTIKERIVYYGYGECTPLKDVKKEWKELNDIYKLYGRLGMFNTIIYQDLADIYQKMK